MGSSVKGIALLQQYPAQMAQPIVRIFQLAYVEKGSTGTSAPQIARSTVVWFYLVQIKPLIAQHASATLDSIGITPTKTVSSTAQLYPMPPIL